MGVDRWLMTVGAAVGLLGLIVAAACSLYARDDSDRPAKPAAGLSSSNEEVIAYGTLAAFVVWVLAAAAVGFAGVEQQVLRVVAALAIVVNIVVIGAILNRARRRRRPRRAWWLVVLLVADVAVSTAPSLFSHPLSSHDRFADLPHWIGSSGTLFDRTQAALKIYDLALIGHVLAQAAGFGMVLAVAMSVAYLCAQHSPGTAARSTGGAKAIVAVLVVTAIGVFLMSGAAVELIDRHFATTSWTAGAADSSSAPPVALQADSTGRLSLLIARCGRERLQALTVNGIPAAPVLLDPPAAPVTTYRLPALIGKGPVYVRLASTRFAASIVTFNATPRARGFLPARVGDTRAQFNRAGHAC